VSQKSRRKKSSPEEGKSEISFSWKTPGGLDSILRQKSHELAANKKKNYFRKEALKRDCNPQGERSSRIGRGGVTLAN